jgi:hypothetical protein
MFRSGSLFNDTVSISHVMWRRMRPEDYHEWRGYKDMDGRRRCIFNGALSELE